MAAISPRAAAGRRRLTGAYAAAALFLLPFGPRPQSASLELVSREVFLMGTQAVLSTWSDSRAEGLATVERLLMALEATEVQLSTWRAESEVSRLNAAAGSGPFSLSSSLCTLVNTLESWTRDTERAFDASIGALIATWDLHGRGRVPTRAQLARARAHSGWHLLAFNANACTLTLAPGTSLDVGAFGKGEALDRARAAIPDAEPWLIDLGGQVAVSGTPPGSAGWPISIADPHRRDTAALRLTLSRGSLATSGRSERDLRVGRTRVGHILDPRTGRPAVFEGSVSVWHEQALVADVLSTALFVMGPEKGGRWADARGIAALYLIPNKKGVPITRASRAFANRFY